jgi:cobaltochelatase CobT
MNAHVLRILDAMAPALFQRSDVSIVVHPTTWAWEHRRRVILVAKPDLDRGDLDVCCGILAHEAAHSFISRYDLFRLDFPSQRALCFLMNAIEEPRVNAWARRTYPGSARWLERAHAAYAPDPHPDWSPSFLQFCNECVAEELRNWAPPPPQAWMRDPVRRALDRTRAARWAYASTLPPADLDSPSTFPELEARYARERRRRAFACKDAAPPSRREQLVRLSALDAARIAEREILPEAAKLWESDRRSAARRIAAFGANPRRSEATAELEAMLDDAGGPCLAGRATSRHRRSEASAPQEYAGVPRSRRAAGAAAPLSYGEALARVSDQLEPLRARLDAALRPRKRGFRRRPSASGIAVELDRLMAHEADPRRSDRIWLRRSRPERRDVAAALLVDLSGSMAGERVQAAQCGTILLAETLERLGVAFAVYGFQDVLIPFHDFGAPLDARARQTIAEMPLEALGTRAGGNNKPGYNDDGPCVREAARRLVARPARERILIVLSDGLPCGAGSGAPELHSAVRSLSGAGAPLALIGVGVGPRTRHVRDFYPNSLADVPLERFAAELGDLVDEVLRDGAARLRA